MPIYEFRCDKCGSKFDVMRGISASLDDVKCPKCGAEKPARVMSAVCGGGHVTASGKGNLHFPT